MRKRWILLAAAGLAGVGAITWSAMASNVETPNYSVSSKSDNLEIREYGPTIVAEATVEGERDKRFSADFALLRIISSATIYRLQSFRQIVECAFCDAFNIHDGNAA